MKYIEIDGITVKVDDCNQCPCFNQGDGGYESSCNHPLFEDTKETRKAKFCDYFKYCPLREVE